MDNIKFKNGKMFVLISEKYVLVIEATKKMKFDSERFFEDQAALYLLPNEVGFEEVDDALLTDKAGGRLLRVKDLLDLVETLNEQSPYIERN